MRLGAVLSVAARRRDAVGAVAVGDEHVLARVRGVGQLGRQIGRVLFTDHAFAFEVTSVLILVAMVGAVVLAAKEH